MPFCLPWQLYQKFYVVMGEIDVLISLCRSLRNMTCNDVSSGSYMLHVYNHINIQWTGTCMCTLGLHYHTIDYINHPVDDQALRCVEHEGSLHC